MTTSRSIRTTVCAAMALVGLLGCSRGEASGEGSTRAEAVDESVADPYAWTEAMSSERVVTWAKERDQAARAFTATVAVRDRLLERIESTAATRRFTAPVERGDRLFGTSFDSSMTRVSVLVWPREGGVPRVVVDGNAILEDEGLRVHRVVWPSPDGRRLAYGVGAPASRWMELRVLDVESGEDLPDSIEGLAGILSNVTWVEDGSGFFYERFELPAEEDRLTSPLRREEIRWHRLGDPVTEDELIFAAPDPDNDVLTSRIGGDPRYLVVGARDGRDRGDRVTVIDLAVAPRRVIEVTDDRESLTRFVGTHEGTLWLRTNHDAPNGRVVAVDLTSPSTPWRDVVPEGRWPIDSWVGAGAVGDAIVVGYREAGALAVRLFERDGTPRLDVDLPWTGSVWSGFVGEAESKSAYYTLSGFVDPGSVYRLDLATGRSTAFVRPETSYDPTRIVTRLIYTEGPGGSRLPMFLAHDRDVEPDGSRPVMVYGYGFARWAAAPWFRSHLDAWFSLGGVFALPALRGGGELGESWFLDGAGANRQNGIDDYVAATEWLIENGYASSELVVAETQSAGASLVGGAVVQRPELYGAAIYAFPLLDMMRYEAYTGGHRWRSGLGSVENPAERAALRDYSPVQNVRSDVCYPPTLLLPGEKDEITPPMHAFKMALALETVQSCEAPVLLRVAWGAGHAYGASSTESAESFADQLAFLIQVLGAEVPERSGWSAADVEWRGTKRD